MKKEKRYPERLTRKIFEVDDILKCEFFYDPQKNKKLLLERGWVLKDLVNLMKKGSLLDDIEHPNQDSYPGQRIYVFEVEGSVWGVPFFKQGNKVFLKTAFPSRKYTKLYMKGESK